MNIIEIGEAPYTFVFLHGLFGQGRNWTTIAKNLLPASSLLVDLPNHGRSEWTDHFSYESMADSVASLLSTLPHPVCLVGHSMGGRVAMMTALTHPEHIDRLVVEDTSPTNLSMDEFISYAHAMSSIDPSQLTSRTQARHLLAESVPDPRILGFLLQNLQPDETGHWHWLPNLALLERDMGQIGLWPHIGTHFDKPVLWITGATSTRTSPADLSAMRTLFPLTRQYRVKSAGHWVHADAPDIFVAALRSFIFTGAKQSMLISAPMKSSKYRSNIIR